MRDDTAQRRRSDLPEFEAAVRAVADAHRVQVMVTYIGPKRGVMGIVRCDGQANAQKLLRGTVSLAERTLRNLPAIIDLDLEPEQWSGAVFDLVKNRKSAL